MNASKMDHLVASAVGGSEAGGRLLRRIPAEVNLGIGQAEAQAGQYIAEYNIWMHHLVDARGQRLFPPKMRLLTHWNLRDEIKADYADPRMDWPNNA